MSETRIDGRISASVDVLIQGAGMGGLCLAAALLARGRSVLVVERSNSLSEVGAGIWMAPNAMQVFEQLGFADSVVRAGWAVEVVRLQDVKDGVLQETDFSEVSKSFGFETIALHRAVLQRVLYERVAPDAVRFGCEVDSLLEDGGSICVRLSDGSAYQAKLVIGADGIHSRIRSMAGLGGIERYSGTSSYRAIARKTSVLPETSHEAYEIWAPGCRLGFSKINSTDIYWYLTFDAPAGERMTMEQRQAHAGSLFDSFFPAWTGLLEGTRPEEILRTDIWDLKRLPRWSSGRIGLIGDAAHATTPNLGQGGAMAVEDAFVLGVAIDQHGLNEAALQSFEKRRREKVDWTVATSWSIGKLCHLSHPLARSFRNFAMRHTPKGLHEKQFRRLYSRDR